MENPKNILGCLCDLTFKEFVTTKVIKLLYVLIVIASAITALAFIIKGFGLPFGHGLVCLVMSVIGFALAVIIARIWLEVIMILFRIEENTRPAESQTQDIASEILEE